MSKTWLITGASRGLGRRIALAALARGHRVAATARDPGALSDVVARYGTAVRAIALDVDDPGAAVRAVDETLAAFGRLDVLVNNAGYGHTAPFEQMAPEDFDAQFRTNFLGVVNVTRAVLPHLRAQRGGHVFQVSSVGGRTSTPGLSAYQAAKWAVGGFSDVLAKEVAHLGIRVCTLEPGGMRTEWGHEARRGLADLMPDYEPSVGRTLELLGAYVGHEIGDPMRIADLIVELSDRDDLPLRLLLGGDALYVCTQSEAQRDAEREAWRDATLSTHFPGAQLPQGLDALKGLK
ncbi:SDR family NAD(P)-dependent oxidoreductase [Pseudoxanthomonas putridarboris]|uniref:SDR family NAD(P)-dependent oxidoreductase n=1 Tax=Pseudoxanthomonas putridarboris TaxID=752605 RepID=A0ABU9J1R8_9GAMM